ncbi:hypothetical protein HN51_059085, partial [Arachis hypogaea]
MSFSTSLCCSNLNLIQLVKSLLEFCGCLSWKVLLVRLLSSTSSVKSLLCEIAYMNNSGTLNLKKKEGTMDFLGFAV